VSLESNFDAEHYFLAHLRQIEQIIAFVCRRNHVDAQDAEEFASHTKLKLIDGNYAILRKFEGRSLFTTYLTTVIQRLFFQYRVQLWGKWRPSAEAKRLGDKAVALERLMTRDGYSFTEAVDLLTSTPDSPFTAHELEVIYVRLPPRMPRPMLVSDADAPDVAAGGDGADASNDLMSAERECTARKAAAALDACIAGLDAEDQIILRMRFANSMRVPDIARILNLDMKKLYKRIEKLLIRLRIALEKAGIARADIEDLFAHGDQEISLCRFHEEKPPRGPSNSGDGGFGDGARPPIGLR
jgi:RNA polymerase sigma factor for flagellar operon FliA